MTLRWHSGETVTGKTASDYSKGLLFVSDVIGGRPGVVTSVKVSQIVFVLNDLYSTSGSENRLEPHHQFD